MSIRRAMYLWSAEASYSDSDNGVSASTKRDWVQSRGIEDGICSGRRRRRTTLRIDILFVWASESSINRLPLVARVTRWIREWECERVPKK